MWIGAAIALAGAIIPALAALVLDLIRHRREKRAERDQEKRTQIDKLVEVAQKAVRHCMMYRSNLTEWVIRGEPIRPSDAVDFSDTASRIARLYVKECEVQTDALVTAVEDFCRWALLFADSLLAVDEAKRGDLIQQEGASNDQFTQNFEPVKRALGDLEQRCGELMAAL